MWTDETRRRHDRRRLRYMHDLTDTEWVKIEPLIPPARRGGNRRTVNVREIVNGLMYILGTGCQWRDILKDLPPRSTLHDYLDCEWAPNNDSDSHLMELAACMALDSVKESKRCEVLARGF